MSHKEVIDNILHLTYLLNDHILHNTSLIILVYLLPYIQDALYHQNYYYYTLYILDYLLYYNLPIVLLVD